MCLLELALLFPNAFFCPRRWQLRITSDKLKLGLITSLRVIPTRANVARHALKAWGKGRIQREGWKREEEEKDKAAAAYVEALFAQFFFSSHLAGLMRKPSTSWRNGGPCRVTNSRRTRVDSSTILFFPSRLPFFSPVLHRNPRYVTS